MPTKRRRVTRGRNGAVTMDNLPFEQLLQLAAGWMPGASNERERRFTHWVTWKDFLTTWVAVRDEFLSREQWGDPPVFAEQVYQTFGASGPPANITHDELHAAIAAAEDEAAAELLADIKI